MAAVAVLVCVAGVVYDRPATQEGLRAYYRWVRAIDLSPDCEPFEWPIAVLGVPLVLWPALSALFGAAFPLISGDSLPEAWFFAVGFLTPVALLVQSWRLERA